ncbi:MAG: hypothetical protein MUF01_14860 [Bryobacterales bacterium]|jgi:hypothetical protein|nr:hypothetical protein [Bryobacterales bacterium]
MPKLALSHLEAALLFAFFTSVVLGIVSKHNDRDRLRYGVKCFAYFAGALFAAGWLMYLGHG